MITIEYECKDVRVGEVIQWCYDNCIEDYAFGRDWDKQMKEGKDCHIMKFESEKDAALFSLRWL